jgi:hypothetical protein
MPEVSGKRAVKKYRPLSDMLQLKRRIVEVEAPENCLAHALIIAIAKVEIDPNHLAYR